MMSLRRTLVNYRRRSTGGFFKQELNKSCSSIRSVSTHQWLSSQSPSFSKYSSNQSNIMIGLVATSMAFGMFLSNKKVVQCESKKTQDTTSSPQSSANPMNPIENVNMLLRLYEQIDQNMEILGERMLKELQEKIEEVSYVFLLILY
jgi:hypothetical protein